MVCHEGVFDSPSASLLPDEAKQVRFLTAAPPRVRGPWCGERNHDSEADIFPASIIFLMPSTGEQEYGARLQLARTLVARHGAVCVLPTVPFYGARRPLGQREHYIGTVAVFALQSLITSCEAALLIEWAHILFPRAALCVSGFSWGGAMASTAGLLASRLIGGGGSERLTRRTDQSGRLVINGGSGDDAAFAARAPALSRSPARRPGRGGRSKSRGREPLARVSSPSPPPPRIAIVSYAGSASPAILVDGLLAGDVDWTALGATAAQHGMDASRESMRTHLFERLSALNLDNFVAEWERRRSSGNGSNQRQRGSRTDASDMYESQVRDSLATSAIRAILCISMSHDHFVRKEWGQILFRTLTAAAPPGTHARFEVRSGGHAYAFLKRSTHQVGAINDALELMLQRED